MNVQHNCYPSFRTAFDRTMQKRHSNCCMPGPFQPCFPQMKENYSSNLGQVAVLAPQWCGYSKKAKQQEESYARELEGKFKIAFLTDEQDPRFKELAARFDVKGFPHVIVTGSDGSVNQFSGYLDPTAFAAKVLGASSPRVETYERRLGDAYTGHSLCSIM